MERRWPKPDGALSQFIESIMVTTPPTQTVPGLFPSHTRSTNAYTNNPTLSDNLLIGCLQLVVWLLIHPSAWHNHLAQLDPSLGDDFFLLSLSRAQLKKPALRRLLIQGCVVWAGILTLLALLILWAARASLQEVVFILPFSLVITAAIGI